MALQEELRNLWNTSQEACVSITFFFHLNILVFQTIGKQPYSLPASHVSVRPMVLNDNSLFCELLRALAKEKYIDNNITASLQMTA